MSVNHIIIIVLLRLIAVFGSISCGLSIEGSFLFFPLSNITKSNTLNNKIILINVSNNKHQQFFGL